MDAKAASAAVAVIGPQIPIGIAQAAAELGFVPRHVTSVAAVQAAITESRLDVVVIAHDRVTDGPDITAALRKTSAFARLPILVYGTEDAGLSRSAALKAGATDVVIGPIDRLDLQNRFRLLIELADARRTEASRPAGGERRVEAALREREIVCRLLRAAEARDDATSDHVVRVAAYAIAIAEGLGLPEAEANDIALASTMHDIGKIGVPDSILHKASPLTDSEREAMKQHAERGSRLLDGSSSRLLQLASEIALTHHERWDGAGYPQGLAGQAIPLAGRVVAVADVFDALTSVRVYKPGWPLERARDYLVAHSGSHFDPDCISAFLSRWDDIVAVAEGGSEISHAA